MRHFIAFFFHFGVAGMLLLSVLDSSFLFAPIGNDLLLIVLTARHHESVIGYVLAGAIGSALGAALVDLVCRKGGEEGLEHLISGKRAENLKTKIKSNAAIMILLATVAPPPFPFTAVIGAASAFQYPRLRLLAMVFAGRVVRFGVEGWLAIYYGRGILRIMNSPEFRWSMIVFATICGIGSAFSVVKWVRSRHAA